MSEAREFCIPFVAAIIERVTADGSKEFLIQTRNQIFAESIYNGTFEFAAGSMDKLYENVYDAATREINEETGMTVKCFLGDSRTAPVSPQATDSAFGFRPYCCTQQLKDGKPWIGFIFRCEVDEGTPVGQESESKDVHWVLAADFYKIYKETPEKIFTLELPAWDYYFKEFPL